MEVLIENFFDSLALKYSVRYIDSCKFQKKQGQETGVGRKWKKIEIKGRDLKESKKKKGKREESVEKEKWKGKGRGNRGEQKNIKDKERVHKESKRNKIEKDGLT